MAWKPVRYDEQAQALVIGNGDDQRIIHHGGGDEFIAHVDDLVSASATSLRIALQKAGQTLLVAEGDYHHFDFERSLGGPVSIEAHEGRLVLQVAFEVEDYENDDDIVRERTAQLLGPLMRRSRSEVIDAAMHSHVVVPPWLATAGIAPSTHGRSASEVYQVGVEAEALLSALAGGELARESTLELLRAGHASAILGQHESQWLDVKRQDYDLASDSGKISLAQDVARFANAEDGGLLVIGFAASKQRGTETITKVTPVQPPASGTSRHAKAVDNRLFPPVKGLTIDEINVGDGVLIVINVPPQPEELKPFLVHGAIANGRVEGAFISILRRRGEDSIPIAPQSIHSMLAAGRALLRGSEIPN